MFSCRCKINYIDNITYQVNFHKMLLQTIDGLAVLQEYKSSSKLQDLEAKAFHALQSPEEADWMVLSEELHAVLENM